MLKRVMEVPVIISLLEHLVLKGK